MSIQPITPEATFTQPTKPCSPDRRSSLYTTFLDSRRRRATSVHSVALDFLPEGHWQQASEHKRGDDADHQLLIVHAGHLRSGCSHSLQLSGYREKVDLEKTILRKVGEAIGRFRMIRDGDCIAVGVSGGKDSLTLLEALLLLQKRAPVRFSVRAFTVEQGKFLSPIHPVGSYLRERKIDWTYVEDGPSLRLLSDQPDHGCDVCSRFRRRAVYEIARRLTANVIALGHTADDFCESFLRNALFTGRLSALPPCAWSSKREFRLIRPLVYVTEDLTRAFTAQLGAPVIPCGCSQKTGTVRRSLRDILDELETEHPFVKETLLSALGKIDTSRLLDTRFLNLEDGSESIDEEPATGPLVRLCAN